MSRFSFLSSPPPEVVVEIAARRVGVVAIAREGAGAVVSGYAIEPIPAGAVRPAVNAQNIHDAPTTIDALKRALDRVGRRPKRVGLVIPDSAAKVSLVRFEQPPARTQDLEQLVQWQVRKTAPFRIEDAQISYSRGVTPPEGGQEYLVALARRDIIAEYENVCAAVGAHAGLVDLATFNVANAVLAAGGPPPGDWLLVHVMDDAATIAILRGGDVIFFRHRASEAEEQLSDLVHQTAMYYEDRLGGGGFVRVMLAGAGADAGAIGAALQERLGREVESVDFRGAAPLTDRISASADLLDALAPLVGLAVRDRAA